MIESTNTTLFDLSEIQQDYIKELEEILELIRRNQLEPEEQTKVSTDFSLSPIVDNLNSKKTNEPTGEPPSDTNFETVEIDHDCNVPEWAKKLWKNIAMKCHPDRLNFQKLSAIEIDRRQTWFLDSRTMLQKEQWDKLLHIGVQLGIWVDEIPHAEQHQMLGQEYNTNSVKINNIQNSIAWQWGNAWNDLNLRIKILIVMCEKSKIKPVSRGEFISLLKKFDSE
tara:strand:- start:129 stop:800 length:672 start_codon:yes stop_codon:yes gene_type:complete